MPHPLSLGRAYSRPRVSRDLFLLFLQPGIGQRVRCPGRRGPTSDNAQEGQCRDPSFRVQDTGGWKKHAADLEAGMLRRGMLFSVLKWARGPGEAPVRTIAWGHERRERAPTEAAVPSPSIN